MHKERTKSKSSNRTLPLNASTKEPLLQVKRGVRQSVRKALQN